MTSSPIKISLKILPHAQGLKLPAYETPQSAGMDIAAAIETAQILHIGQRALIPTGLSIALPAGFEAQIRPRSGLAYKNGITVINTPGTIDADYRGEIKVLLANFGQEDFVIERGMRIAQMAIARYEQADWNITSHLEDTERGSGGFGSTGSQ